MTVIFRSNDPIACIRCANCVLTVMCGLLSLVLWLLSMMKVGWLVDDSTTNNYNRVALTIMKICVLSMTIAHKMGRILVCTNSIRFLFQVRALIEPGI